MVFFGRFRRYALIAAGAATLLFAAGCGSDEPVPEAEAKKVVTDVQRQTMRLMNEAAEGAYQSVQKGDLEQTKVRVAQLSVLSTKLSYEGLATVEGIEAVTGSINAAMRALNASSPDRQSTTLKVATARLAVDALSHREQPMWLGFRDTLTGDLEKMAMAVESRNDPAASEALASWRGHLTIVRPAVVVSRSASDAVKLDSITAFLTNALRSGDWDGLRQAMPNLEAALGEVFAEQDRETTVTPLAPTAEPPHPILWSLGLGAFIVSVLTYVAWRRYEADQGVARVKTERDFEGRG
ncbi:sporulation protein YpjB [Paenibacillus sp.]|uniref:sporulation protein YpjB n=1 Tax=Paenibacillus sp. TaxID=58172 RepID=UPI002810C7C4|nr:sporulation protein YpjB [Paenibacillus sp.]